MNTITDQEIIEGNALIAIFMGYNVEIVNNERYFTLDDMLESLSDEELHYNDSWDWLMPVLENIEAIGYRWEIGMSSTSPHHYCKIWSIGTIEGVSPKDATWGAVIEFIKWYNLNKK